MTAVLYAVIVCIATTLGALVGLGGGVIIKPMLDLVGRDTVETVGFLSAAAVFSMSIAATLKHIRQKTPIDKKAVLCVAAGAAAGGVLGNSLFDCLLRAANNDFVKGIQGLLLGCFLVAVNLYLSYGKHTFRVHHPLLMTLAGLLLGLIASFLGVGGGPINVAFFVFFFSYSMKEAAVYSVATIFFSQLTKLITIYIDNQFAPFDLRLLWLLIPAAVIGGIVGAKLNHKCDEAQIRRVFTLAVYAIAAINFYNAFTGLLLPS